MVFQRITVDLWGIRFVFRPIIAGFRLHPKVASFSLPVVHPGDAGFNPLVACSFPGIGWFLSRFAGWRVCPFLSLKEFVSSECYPDTALIRCVRKVLYIQVCFWEYFCKVGEPVNGFLDGQEVRGAGNLGMMFRNRVGRIDMVTLTKRRCVL